MYMCVSMSVCKWVYAYMRVYALYMYVYVCVYTLYMCVCACVWVSSSIYLDILYGKKHESIVGKTLCLCLCVCVSVCISVYVYVSVCV